MAWRRNIDKSLTRQKAEQKAEEARARERQRQREAEERARYQQQLAEHRQKYRCHVCGTPSYGPYIASPQRPNRENGMVSFAGGPVWDYPTGLSTCSICHQYTCSSDLYKEICKTCAQKM